MAIGEEPTVHKKAFRHYGIVMAFAVVGVVFLLYGIPFFSLMGKEFYVQDYTTATTTATVTLGSMERSQPVRLVIPKIKLDTTFVTPLALNPDKTVSVPDNYTQVGWYSGGATPGEIGPAVILGHVDSVSGPAIFYSLGQVVVGDPIMITRADGKVVTFKVTKLQRYPQSEFPTLDVYGPTDHSTLRLVTCTGIYDHGEHRYSHNLVVYAEPAE